MLQKQKLKVFKGDCTKLFEEVNFEQPIDLILTDPPYNIAIDKEQAKAIGRWRNSKTNPFIVSDWDKYTEEQYEKFTEAWMTKACNSLRPKGYMCIWNTFKYIPLMVRIAEQNGLKWVRLLTWCKTNGAISFPQDFIPSSEYAVLFYKQSKDNNFKKYRSKTITRDFFISPIVGQKERLQANHHPTMKPVHLFKSIIEKLCPPKGLVVDPFLGSGTALVAARGLDRNCIGFEIDANYVKIIQKRLDNLTNTNLEDFFNGDE